MDGSFKNINKKIIEKLENFDCNNVSKKFIKDILIIELENFEGNKIHFRDEYHKALNKVFDTSRGENYEN